MGKSWNYTPHVVCSEMAAALSNGCGQIKLVLEIYIANIWWTVQKRDERDDSVATSSSGSIMPLYTITCLTYRLSASCELMSSPGNLTYSKRSKPPSARHGACWWMWANKFGAVCKAIWPGSSAAQHQVWSTASLSNIAPFPSWPEKPAPGKWD